MKNEADFKTVKGNRVNCQESPGKNPESSIYEARLTEDFLESAPGSGYIHSMYKSAINIYFPGREEDKFRFRLITLICGDVGGIPDSLAVSPDFYDIISGMDLGDPFMTEPVRGGIRIYPKGAGSSLQVMRGYLISSGLKIKPADVGKQKCIMKKIEVFYDRIELFRSGSAEKGMKDGFSDFNEVLKDRFFRQLSDFCVALISADAKKIRSIVREIAGLGKGLTPSADDAVIGALAVFTGEVMAFGAEEGHRFNEMIAGTGSSSDFSIMDFVRFDDILPGRTTDVSIKYLCCAHEGRFSDTVRVLNESLWSAEEMPDIKTFDQLLIRAGSFGATSGLDMLAGMSAALRVILLNKVT